MIKDYSVVVSTTGMDVMAALEVISAALDFAIASNKWDATEAQITINEKNWVEEGLLSSVKVSGEDGKEPIGKSRGYGGGTVERMGKTTWELEK